ncbi:MAG: peptidoglycan editing factor PgeF [Pseudomonadota bacterium]
MTAPTLNLEPLQSSLLDDVRHGFFSRRGGASSGIFAGLNCGGGSSDQAAIVAKNCERVATAMGVRPDHLLTVRQHHSAAVATILDPAQDLPRADAIVTATPGVALAILTADCQPVLFADRSAGVIGAAHAGWKGARDGVLEATLDAMEALGARRAATRAVIGPSISQRNYEVGEEFFERFFDDDPANARFFVNGAEGKYHFDLPAYGLMRLREAGIEEAEWTRHCTYADETRFYSYRRSVHRSEADYGRLMSAIRL